MGAVLRPANTLAAASLAVGGGYVIGQISELETVLLAVLGCIVGLVASFGAPPHARPRLLWTGVACLLVGGAAGLIVARVPVEQGLTSAVRSVVLNPVILAGFAVGGRLCYAYPGWAARPQPQPDAPSASSHPAPRPARTPVGGSR
jgi:hypothetical protein